MDTLPRAASLLTDRKYICDYHKLPLRKRLMMNEAMCEGASNHETEKDCKLRQT